jgi:hypothetical protein
MFTRSLLNRSLMAAALTAGLFVPSAALQAASQILGIVASNGTPTPLVCDEVDCGALFSAFCLQEAHPAPFAGQDYSVAPGGNMTLIVSTTSGQTLRLPAQDYVSITSRIGFTSVHVAVPLSTMAELGATDLRLEVGPNVSLLPMAVVGDVQPQTADEIAYATTIMRQAAVKKFDMPNPTADAARIASVLINALPAHSLEDPDVRKALWTAKANDPVLTRATPEGLTMAEDMYRSCEISVEARSSYSMRVCLELRHADLQASANHQFWKDTAAY